MAAVHPFKHRVSGLLALADVRMDGERNCSGEISSIAASPSRTRSSASCRSGIDSMPLTVTAADIPARASPCTPVRVSRTALIRLASLGAPGGISPISYRSFTGVFSSVAVVMSSVPWRVSVAMQ